MKSTVLICVATISSMLACAPATKVTVRNEITAVSSSPVDHDGISMQAKVYGVKEASEHPRLGRTVPATINKLGFNVQGKVGFSLVTPPVFEVRFTNSTNHVVRTKGTVIKLTDAAGNTYDPKSKDELQATLDQAIQKMGDGVDGQKVTLDSGALTTLKGAITSIKILDQNAEILPNVTETFYVCFNLPVEPTADSINQWLSSQTTLTLKVFDLTTETDAAGTPTKKAQFDFPINIKSTNQ